MYLDLSLHRAEDLKIVIFDRRDLRDRPTALLNNDAFGVEMIEDVETFGFELRDTYRSSFSFHGISLSYDQSSDQLFRNVAQADDRLMQHRYFGIPALF